MHGNSLIWTGFTSFMENIRVRPLSSPTSIWEPFLSNLQQFGTASSFNTVDVIGTYLFEKTDRINSEQLRERLRKGILKWLIVYSDLNLTSFIAIMTDLTIQIEIPNIQVATEINGSKKSRVERRPVTVEEVVTSFIKWYKRNGLLSRPKFCGTIHRCGEIDASIIQRVLSTWYCDGSYWSLMVAFELFSHSWFTDMKEQFSNIGIWIVLILRTRILNSVTICKNITNNDLSIVMTT